MGIDIHTQKFREMFDDTPQKTVDTTDRKVEGKMVMVRMNMGPMELSNAKVSDEDMKRELCNRLAYELYKSDCIEFTKAYDGAHLDIVFVARTFAAPKSFVKEWREHELWKVMK